MKESHPAYNLFYTVIDTESPIFNSPAMTTVYYNICNKNRDKFTEVSRIIGLFMEAAYEKGKSDAKDEL